MLTHKESCTYMFHKTMNKLGYNVSFLLLTTINKYKYIGNIGTSVEAVHEDLAGTYLAVMHATFSAESRGRRALRGTLKP